MMSDRFGTEGAPDRPEFVVSVNGTDLEATTVRDVLELDIDERVNGHAIAQILLRNWDQETRTPLYSTGELFSPGAELAVRAGYRSELNEIFTGLITSLTVNFPPESMGVVVVEARSESALMATPRRVRVHEDQNLSDRFSAIADDYGLQGDVADSDVVETHYDDCSDWDRVLRAACERGWVSYVREGKLCLKPPADPEDPVELTYGQNVLELRLTEDLRLRSDPITAAVWDTDELQVIESEADASGAGFDVSPRSDLTTALGESALKMRARRIHSRARGSQSEADAYATGSARWEQLAQITGTGVAIGLPQLRCDQWLKLAGSGDRTDGAHYVSRVRHRIGKAGYTTEFTLGLPARLEPSTSPKDACPTRGSGVLLGLVTDTNDPDSAGRIKVSFATSGADVGDVWARLATLDAGPDHGSVFIPAVGNEVVVGFAGRDPIVLGQLYSAKHPPPLDIDAEANKIRGFQTPGGHKIILDDDTTSIEVTTPEGNVLVLSDDDGSVKVAEPGGNELLINGDGITLTAASGDITLSAATGKVKIDASGIEAAATGPSKFESNATLDISASATLGLSGALVNIN